MKNICFAVVGFILCFGQFEFANASTFECHYELNSICGNQGGSSSRVSEAFSVVECTTLKAATAQIEQQSMTSEGDCMTFASRIACVQR